MTTCRLPSLRLTRVSPEEDTPPDVAGLAATVKGGQAAAQLPEHVLLGPLSFAKR